VLEIRLVAKILLLPPAAQFLLLLLGWLLWRRYPTLARGCIVVSLLSLWLLSTPFVASRLAQSIEPPALKRESLPTVRADAIVILSANLRQNAAEFGEPVTSRHGVERLRYGAFLHRQLDLPVAISGGPTPAVSERSIAEFMAIELREVFGIDATWLETRSRITAENARFTFEMLAPQGKTRILLVSHAMHMRRATLLFERAGFDVVQAPTAFVNSQHRLPAGLLPMAYALSISSEALHEIIGYYYYRLGSTW
jgi:uncharacterized SAM-binding protein YcdF (DUF218 family)